MTSRCWCCGRGRSRTTSSTSPGELRLPCQTLEKWLLFFRSLAPMVCNIPSRQIFFVSFISPPFFLSFFLFFFFPQPNNGGRKLRPLWNLLHLLGGHHEPLDCAEKLRQSSLGGRAVRAIPTFSGHLHPLHPLLYTSPSR